MSYFDTKSSMFVLTLSDTEEGAPGPQNGPKGFGDLKSPQSSAGFRRRGTEHPNLLVYIY